MKIQNHINRITEKVLSALMSNKEILIAEILNILYDTQKLVEQDFKYWIEHIEKTEVSEIPITKKGIAEAIHEWNTPPTNRNELIGAINSLCLYTLTYSNEEICEFQADYRYYFHIPTKTVFKESDLGNSDLKIKNVQPNDIRIARLSELNIPKEELW